MWPHSEQIMTLMFASLQLAGYEVKPLDFELQEKINDFMGDPDPD